MLFIKRCAEFDQARADAMASGSVTVAQLLDQHPITYAMNGHVDENDSRLRCSSASVFQIASSVSGSYIVRTRTSTLTAMRLDRRSGIGRTAWKFRRSQGQTC